MSGAISLISVICVLVLVSLPRLRAFILLENAADARSTVRYLASEFALLGQEHPDPQVGDLLAKSRKLRHALSDTEVLAEGRLIRRHGYLFAFVPRSAIERNTPGNADENSVSMIEANVQRPDQDHIILAWPWSPENSQLVLGTIDGKLYAPLRKNSAWSGPDLDPLVLPPLERWKRVY